MKLKKGDKVRFSFAGSEVEGEFVEEGISGRDNTSRRVIKCKGKDGTIYPVDVNRVIRCERE